MALKFSLCFFSVLLLFIFSLFLNSCNAQNDPIIQTMEEFSGYPSIQDSHISNPEAQQDQATDDKATAGAEDAYFKAKLFISSLLAKGYILGKNAVDKAKAFDEKHQLTSTTTASIVSFDKKIGISEKVVLGTSIVNDKVRELDQKHLVSEKIKSAFSVGSSTINDKVLEVDQKLQVSHKFKSAIAAADQTVSSARTAILKNQYVVKGASCISEAFDSFAKAALEVSQHAKNKVGMAEAEQRLKTA